MPHERLSLKEAWSFWQATTYEKHALAGRRCFDEITRLDQIWPILQEAHGEVLAVDAPHCAIPERFSYSELASKISIAAEAFKNCGIKSGEVVAIFAENSPRWLICDQGIMRLGAANAVRGTSAPIEELKYILEDSGAIGLVVQNQDLLEELSLANNQLDRLKVVIQLEGSSSGRVLEWDDFLSKGSQKAAITLTNDWLNDTRDIATILYTSGTTGKPKGVPLSHANFLHQIRSLACVANPPVGSPVLSVLPIWHAYERSAEYYFFTCGCTQSYTTIKHLKSDLPRVKPFVMATVPRLWEAIQAGFDDAVKSMPQRRQSLIKKALSNSAAYKLAIRKTRDLCIEKQTSIKRSLAFIEVLVRWPMHSFAATFMWPKVLKQLCGGKLKFPINGGGAIAPHVDSFFESLGIELLVGYGLTETSPVLSCRRPWRNVRGSSGQPLPQTEFRIVDPDTSLQKSFRECGRVLTRGPQVMRGYLGNPEATAKVLDGDGWFDTGDLGMLLPDGSLVLTGRAKDTIVLSSGENIEPGPLEEVLLASPLFEQVMLVGQDQKSLGALIVPRVEPILALAKKSGLFLDQSLGGEFGNKELRKLLRKEINNLLMNRSGSRPEERVIGVAVVDSFSIENGLLTQTLKQRREKIARRDANAITSIYLS